MNRTYRTTDPSMEKENLIQEFNLIPNKGPFRPFNRENHSPLVTFHSPNGIFVLFVHGKFKILKTGKIQKNEPFIEVEYVQCSLDFPFSILEIPENEQSSGTNEAPYVLIGLQKRIRNRSNRRKK